MSKKMPFMPIDILALLSDTAELSPCTFGIWMRVLLNMFYDGKSGEISGTIERLARRFGATVEEMKTAIDELDETGTADVLRECNGDVIPMYKNVTLINRRMKNELANRKGAALRVSNHRSKNECNSDVQNCNVDVTDDFVKCNADVTTHKSKSNNNKNTLSALERVTSPVVAPVDNSKTDVQNSLSQTYQNSEFCSEVEQLATLIETSSQFGECSDIGGVARRNAIHYQAEAFPASDTGVWFRAITEAITAAQVGTREGDIVTAMRKYPDGVLDSGKVSRCDESIRLTAQKLKAGACAKALAYLPDRRKRVTTVPESLMEADCAAF